MRAALLTLALALCAVPAAAQGGVNGQDPQLPSALGPNGGLKVECLGGTCTGAGGGGGIVAIDQTTPGISNGVQLTAAVPTGGNVIGHVIVDSSGVVHIIIDSAATLAVTGPLTDTQLRATALAVSGAFFQATQPVSIASMPSTPVTGAFFQATQPVSGTVAASNMIPAVETGLAKDATLSAITTNTAVEHGTDGTGGTHAVATDPTGVTLVAPIAAPRGLPLLVCNPVRRTNCAPKGF